MSAESAKTPKKTSTRSKKTTGSGTGVASKTRKTTTTRKTTKTTSSKTKKAPAEEPKKTTSQAASAPAPVAEKPSSAPPPAPAPSDSSDADDKNISMKPPIVVKELAAKLDCKPFQLIHELMAMNVFATLNQAIEEEIAKKICENRGFTFNVEKREKGAGVHKPEPVKEPPPPKPVKEEHLEPRPPVVTFMGHVDHGKTSILDAIRQTRVVAGEAGGITQHIGAYTVENKGQTITFLDTPGHEAFTSMRARGANVTDIVILVVAADDGIMPQTIEAIKHAQAAKVAIIVAINKIDTPGSNPDRVKGQLQEHGLTPEDWGGETICCEVSATQKTGIDKLLEMIQLQAEMLELKAKRIGNAIGTIIESQMEQGRGPTATVLIQRGTLKTGDAFICGTHWGKAKALINNRGETFKQAPPSTPAKIIGFSGVPSPGEEFTIVDNEREARRIAEERAENERVGKLSKSQTSVTLENIFASTGDQKKNLNLVLKADVQGSLEAIIDSLNKIKSDKVEVNFILTSVGPISASDVLLAKASEAVIIGFSTKTESSAASTAKREHVQIKLYSIIYELIDQVKEAMAGLLDPEVRETQIGTASVKKVFQLSKFPVAGCIVENGRIARSGRARVMRKKQPIYDGGIVTLKRFQDDVNEVRSGMECGIRLGNFNEYEEGDTIECYQLEKIAQTL